MQKCRWALASTLEELYHDREWGVPVHDDRLLLEFLILEGAQAGLSWRTVLSKRDAYRSAFADFDAQIIAEYDDAQLQRLIQNPDIIRNRLKLRSAIDNARAFVEIQQRYGSFERYIWQFVDGRTVHNRRHHEEPLPAFSPESEQMSKSLKKHGFSFVGPTICYAFMQAVGMVNDHEMDCFRYRALAGDS